MGSNCKPQSGQERGDPYQMENQQQTRPGTNVVKEVLSGLQQDSVVYQVNRAVAEKDVAPERRLHHGDQHLDPERADNQTLMRSEANPKNAQCPINELVLMGRIQPSQHQ